VELRGDVAREKAKDNGNGLRVGLGLPKVDANARAFGPFVDLGGALHAAIQDVDGAAKSVEGFERRRRKGGRKRSKGRSGVDGVTGGVADVGGK
jgi:hypothetical protein